MLRPVIVANICNKILIAMLLRFFHRLILIMKRNILPRTPVGSPLAYSSPWYYYDLRFASHSDVNYLILFMDRSFAQFSSWTLASQGYVAWPFTRCGGGRASAEAPRFDRVSTQRGRFLLPTTIALN